MILLLQVFLESCLFYFFTGKGNLRDLGKQILIKGFCFSKFIYIKNVFTCG